MEKVNGDYGRGARTRSYLVPFTPRIYSSSLHTRILSAQNDLLIPVFFLEIDKMCLCSLTASPPSWSPVLSVLDLCKFSAFLVGTDIRVTAPRVQGLHRLREY